MKTKPSQHKPSLPEIIRVDTSSVESAVNFLVSELTPTGHGFNYLRATKAVMAAYKGVSKLETLLHATATQREAVGFEPNNEVIRLAAPDAFGRSTHLIPLGSRRLPYGGDRFASYRIPFFFVEQGVFKAYFLQPRKNTTFTLKQYGLFATVVKRFLLDMEFYSEPVDIVIVDLSCGLENGLRYKRQYTLADLTLWDDFSVENHFDVVKRALEIIENEKLIPKIRRPLKDKDLPLFD